MPDENNPSCDAPRGGPGRQDDDIHDREEDRPQAKFERQARQTGLQPSESLNSADAEGVRQRALVYGTKAVAVSSNKQLTSKFRGVCWNKKNKRWQAAINSSGKYLYLGSYDTEAEAAAVFDKAAVRIRGSKARLNFCYSDYVDGEGKLRDEPHIDELIHDTANPSKPRRARGAGGGGAATPRARGVGTNRNSSTSDSQTDDGEAGGEHTQPQTAGTRRRRRDPDAEGDTWLGSDEHEPSRQRRAVVGATGGPDDGHGSGAAVERFAAVGMELRGGGGGSGIRHRGQEAAGRVARAAGALAGLEPGMEGGEGGDLPDGGADGGRGGRLVYLSGMDLFSGGIHGRLPYHGAGGVHVPDLEFADETLFKADGGRGPDDGGAPLSAVRLTSGPLPSLNEQQRLLLERQQAWPQGPSIWEQHIHTPKSRDKQPTALPDALNGAYGGDAAVSEGGAGLRRGGEESSGVGSLRTAAAGAGSPPTLPNARTNRAAADHMSRLRSHQSLIRNGVASQGPAGSAGFAGGASDGGGGMGPLGPRGPDTGEGGSSDRGSLGGHELAGLGNALLTLQHLSGAGGDEGGLRSSRPPSGNLGALGARSAPQRGGSVWQPEVQSGLAGALSDDGGGGATGEGDDNCGGDSYRRNLISRSQSDQQQQLLQLRGRYRGLVGGGGPLAGPGTQPQVWDLVASPAQRQPPLGSLRSQLSNRPSPQLHNQQLPLTTRVLFTSAYDLAQQPSQLVDRLPRAPPRAQLHSHPAHALPRHVLQQRLSNTQLAVLLDSDGWEPGSGTGSRNAPLGNMSGYLPAGLQGGAAGTRMQELYDRGGVVSDVDAELLEVLALAQSGLQSRQSGQMGAALHQHAQHHPGQQQQQQEQRQQQQHEERGGVVGRGDWMGPERLGRAAQGDNGMDSGAGGASAQTAGTAARSGGNNANGHTAGRTGGGGPQGAKEADGGGDAGGLFAPILRTLPSGSSLDSVIPSSIDNVVGVLYHRARDAQRGGAEENGSGAGTEPSICAAVWNGRVQRLHQLGAFASESQAKASCQSALEMLRDTEALVHAASGGGGASGDAAAPAAPSAAPSGAPGARGGPSGAKHNIGGNGGADTSSVATTMHLGSVGSGGIGSDRGPAAHGASRLGTRQISGAAGAGVGAPFVNYADIGPELVASVSRNAVPAAGIASTSLRRYYTSPDGLAFLPMDDLDGTAATVASGGASAGCYRVEPILLGHVKPITTTIGPRGGQLNGGRLTGISGGCRLVLDRPCVNATQPDPAQHMGLAYENGPQYGRVGNGGVGGVGIRAGLGPYSNGASGGGTTLAVEGEVTDESIVSERYVDRYGLALGGGGAGVGGGFVAEVKGGGSGRVVGLGHEATAREAEDIAGGAAMREAYGNYETRLAGAAADGGGVGGGVSGRRELATALNLNRYGPHDDDGAADDVYVASALQGGQRGMYGSGDGNGPTSSEFTALTQLANLDVREALQLIFNQQQQKHAARR